MDPSEVQWGLDLGYHHWERQVSSIFKTFYRWEINVKCVIFNCTKIESFPCCLARFKKFDDQIYNGCSSPCDPINTPDNSSLRTCSNSNKDKITGGKANLFFSLMIFCKQMKNNKLPQISFFPQSQSLRPIRVFPAHSRL